MSRFEEYVREWLRRLEETDRREAGSHCEE